MFGVAGNNFGSAISRVIINYYQVKAKGDLLIKYGTNGILYSLAAVANRDNHRCFNRKSPLLKSDLLEVGGQPCADCLQVAGADFFHLYLNLTHARIDIVKDLFSTAATVAFPDSVEWFWNMEYLGSS